MYEFQINQVGNKIRYLDFPGEKTPILFIHGLGCASSYDYPNVVTQSVLSMHRRILVDLIGYGFSDKPDDHDYSIKNHVKNLIRLIEYLEIDRLFLFGHSMGGAVAIDLANSIVDKVAGLIITEGNLDVGGGFYSRKIANQSQDDYKEKGHEKIIRRNKSNNWSLTLKMCAPESIHKNSSDLVEGCEPSWRNILYSLNMKRAFIFGEKSLPDKDEVDLTNNGIQVEIVKGAGHNMAIENPKGLSQAILNCL